MKVLPKIIAIIGARPQFIKHYPFESAAKGKLNLITIHTGQHYDENMSNIFFKQFGMSRPKYILNNGGGNHGEQTGNMMIEIERIVLNENPNAVLVYGDTNSTLAGALVGAKLKIPVFHIEAGLRSYNKEMPEEVNRVLTDHISTLLFTPSEVAVQNLKNEGIQDGVYNVGDIMKDLVFSVCNTSVLNQAKLEFNYYYSTIHRPYNTDLKERLSYLLESLNNLDKKVVFSIHPRTTGFMVKHGMHHDKYPNIIFIEPQSYFDNLNFLVHADALITDSGGMQKEAYWLQKKCVTIRKETEWVETLEHNANMLMFGDLKKLNLIIKESPKKWNNNLYGDGNSGILIVDLIKKYLK